MANKRIVLITAVLVAAIMVLSSLTILTEAAGQNNSAGTSAAQTTATSQVTKQTSTLSAKASSILQDLQSKGVPSNYVYLPSFKKAAITGTNISGPSYGSAPAPMGIGTYGFSNNSGVITRYDLNTSSFSGAVTFNNFTTFYPYDDGPNSVTVDLNYIVNNVALFGKTNYPFWN